MEKFFLGVAIVAFTSFCGYLLAKKYRKRKEFFSQFCIFNDRFLSEISYYRRPIGEFFSKYAYKSEFSILLNRFLSTVTAGKNIELTVSNDLDFLTKEEKVETENYFLMLGRGDSLSQKAYFSTQKERLAVLEKEAEKAHKKYGDLFIKIGFLCGLLILILII